MYSYKDLSELSGYTSRVYSLLTLLRQLNADKYPSHPRELDGETYDIADTKGNISEDRDGVTFENVPVITPAADAVLVKDLSFELKKGDHLLITGPNGSGKTSVLRLLARLWPVFRGHIGKPRKAPDSVFYLPQRPYLVVGTLRDQVIYPDSVEDMKKKGRTDKELEEILGKVYLGYLVDREGGWGTVKEWKVR